MGAGRCACAATDVAWPTGSLAQAVYKKRPPPVARWTVWSNNYRCSLSSRPDAASPPHLNGHPLDESPPANPLARFVDSLHTEGNDDATTSVHGDVSGTASCGCGEFHDGRGCVILGRRRRRPDRWRALRCRIPFVPTSTLPPISWPILSNTTAPAIPPIPMWWCMSSARRLRLSPRGVSAVRRAPTTLRV